MGTVNQAVFNFPHCTLKINKTSNYLAKYCKKVFFWGGGGEGIYLGYNHRFQFP